MNGGSQIRATRGVLLTPLALAMLDILVALVFLWPTSAAAQAPTADKSAAKEKEKAKEVEKKPAAPDTSDAAAKANEGDVLSFRESEVAAEMSELEERMFRLSEAIKQLEPENSSRLMLGLKFAREELILHQMKETQKLLDAANLGEASAEQKHLVTKLQRLHDLLLSTDLDLQMRLEKLRQLREIIRRLDKVIQEEEREQRLSKNTASTEKQIEGLRKRRIRLEDLIKRQTAHVDEGQEFAVATAAKGSAVKGSAGNDAQTKDGPAKDAPVTKEAPATDSSPKDGDSKSDSSKEASQDAPPQDGPPSNEQAKAIAGLAESQKATQADTKRLAENEAKSGAKLKHLESAHDEMGQAGKSLADQLASAALPHQQSALDALKQQLEETSKDLVAKEAQLSAEKFAALQKDQMGNRQLTDGVTDSVRKLGETGAGALSNLQASTGSMSSAEQDLGQRKPEPASDDQLAAVESLRKARKQLAEETDKLLDQLRAEVKRRVMEDLTLMLEKQIAVRESTTVLGARAASGGRQVTSSIVALANSEGRIITVADDLIALVEETEFGIALPAALTMVRESMAGVKESLAKADASEHVVAREREIEEDLKGLLTAMKQMPSSKDSNPSDPQNASRQRERELNKLVAELKMIRMVQIRVNKATIQTDGGRAAALEALSADLRQRIENVTNQQDDVRDVTERLFLERGEELQ